ncbi:hypothetical protein OVS_02110 [Mycoplasma ovis str. Michigan]|uniref:Uncharacterized protein n=1 Tax=Mycoplasma ovis str. Michigan TaxID=1415773 RepID=A0ABM5P1E1_9MOLU|nr:hypothetical protein OVS_02110 [Mycoplasma ovis str. Michigan]
MKTFISTYVIGSEISKESNNLVPSNLKLSKSKRFNSGS